jgi:FtsP/CotA-like multicopper oxidase with cupredoxin domain
MKKTLIPILISLSLLLAACAPAVGPVDDGHTHIATSTPGSMMVEHPEAAHMMEPNFFTINGKAFPANEHITVKKGERVRLRLISIGQFIHPMHLHRFPFKIVATDGHPVPEAAQLTKDTVSAAPGERYDIEFVPTETGEWMLHCHIPHHTTNEHVGRGGLMLMINVVD